MQHREFLVGPDSICASNSKNILIANLEIIAVATREVTGAGHF
jgi:hypothetical protein